jgi:putative hydrolase of the HAD superfamily
MFKNIIFDLGNVLFSSYLTADGQKRRYIPIPEGVALLTRCYNAQSHGSRAYRLFVLSNHHDNALATLHQDHPTIMKLFDGIVTQTRAQAKKPDAAIFTYLCEQYALNPFESIFIDDTPEHLQTATLLGMTAIECNSWPSVNAAFKALKIFE